MFWGFVVVDVDDITGLGLAVETCEIWFEKDSAKYSDWLR